MKKAISITVMAYCITFIIMSVMAISCQVERPEERAIRKNLEATLNDPKSYESVSFETLNYKMHFSIMNIDFSSFESAFRKSLDGMKDIIMYSIVSANKEVSQFAQPMWDSIIKPNPYPLIDCKNYDSLRFQMSNWTSKTLSLMELVAKEKTKGKIRNIPWLEIRQGYLKWSPAYTQMNYEEKELNQRLSKICIPVNLIEKYFDLGLVWKHTFRAKNSFGALVLNEKTFIMSDKNQVQCIIDID